MLIYDIICAFKKREDIIIDNEIQCIQNLSNEELRTLNLLLSNNNRYEVNDYIKFILENTNCYFDLLKVLKEMSIEYMPIIGINFYHISKNVRLYMIIYLVLIVNMYFLIKKI